MGVRDKGSTPVGHEQGGGMSVVLDFAKLRGEVPRHYLLAFRMDNGFFAVYGGDALHFTGTEGVVNDTDEPLPRVIVTHPEEAFASKLITGKGIALARRRKEESSWCVWEVYALIDRLDEIGRIHDYGEEDDT
jgi:hypothetical protein